MILLLDYIDKHSNYLYVKNPVGKYLDSTLDKRAQGDRRVQMALSSGLLRDVIDIHDNEAIEGRVETFLDAYRPGSGWKCIDNSWAAPWSYYWQAFFKKTAS